MKFHPSSTALRRLASLAIPIAFCIPAFASLGGDVSSVTADQVHMRASVRTTSADSYQVQEIQDPDGTVVTEYISAAGKVFAVTWHGPFMPDLQQILGTYFQQYSAALQSQQKHYGHRPLNLQQPGLAVQTGGHMRDYFGRAYIPTMLPEGVKADELR